MKLEHQGEINMGELFKSDFHMVTCWRQHDAVWTWHKTLLSHVYIRALSPHSVLVLRRLPCGWLLAS